MSDYLKVDLYELSMLAAYLHAKRNPQATFELFVRRLPVNRGYLVVAGLAQAVEFIRSFRFSAQDLDYLRKVPVFSGLGDEFFSQLEGLRFSGDVWAMPEGTLAFANQPLLRVTAPLIEAQLLETYLLTTINFQTMVASKASRIVQAARGRPVADFGSRRAHGSEAGVLAARAAYIGGCAATSNLEAGRRFGIPVTGTMAHSFVMSFATEQEAFMQYMNRFGSDATLLVDTYDTLNGAKLAAGLGPAVTAIRLDSGDLALLSRQARKLLDRAQRKDIKIVASGNLNEMRIEKLFEAGAKLDAFGVGTDLVTSQDAPSLDGVYKLVELVESDGSSLYPVKLSRNKTTWPGKKQVYRRVSKRGAVLSDMLCLADEEPPEGRPLLTQVVKHGQPIGRPESIDIIKERVSRQTTSLPPRFKCLRKPAAYTVAKSKKLTGLLKSVRRQSNRRPG
jgi:nicotinate phosphoribosyltransferase